MLRLKLILILFRVLTFNFIYCMLKGRISVAQGVVHNILAEGTTLIGDIKSQEDFRIDGSVEGNIDCRGKVVVGSNGSIKGQINCSNAEISGKVQGTVKTTGLLVLKSTAVYSGEAFSQTIEIEAGAVFNGSCMVNRNGADSSISSDKS